MRNTTHNIRNESILMNQSVYHFVIYEFEYLKETFPGAGSHIGDKWSRPKVTMQIHQTDRLSANATTNKKAHRRVVRSVQCRHFNTKTWANWCLWRCIVSDQSSNQTARHLCNWKPPPWLKRLGGHYYWFNKDELARCTRLVWKYVELRFYFILGKCCNNYKFTNIINLKYALWSRFFCLHKIMRHIH